MHRLFIATGVIQTLAAALAAQSPLTTAYATTSGGAVGGGVYFDLTVHSGQVITRLDGNYGQMPGTSGSIDVFVRPGTSAGFEGSSAGWTLAGSAPVTAQGVDVASPAIFMTPIALAPGSYGVAIRANGLSHKYTDGSTISQLHSTNEMTASFGQACNVCFAGLPFAPRVWNGSLHYTPSDSLAANFVPSTTNGPIGASVAFTDASFSSDPGGITSWAWDFENDGTIDSTLQNPTHTYGTCGVYDVRLTVTDGAHAPSVALRSGLVAIGQAPITPSFTYARVGPGLFQFTDTSTPTPTSWAWDLDGDGNVDSNAQNPTFAYAPCATADVTLTVADACVGPFRATRSLAAAPVEFTTSLAPNNGLSTSGAGNVFDIDVTNPKGVHLCALTLTPYTTAAGTPITCEVWLTDAPGGYAANHTNAAVWRLVATGGATDTGVSGGPTVFGLDRPVYLPFGRFAMAIATSQGLFYYTEPVDPGIYAGPDFTITCGLGKATLFAAGANSPRGITAKLHYSVFGNGDLAGYGFDGLGCAGSSGQSTLTPVSRPVLGATLRVAIDHCPGNAAVMMAGFGKTTSAFGPLPFDLTAVGAPGCSLRIRPDATLLLLGVNQAVTWSLPIPASNPLLGALMYSQAVVFDPGFNVAGAVGSDAAAMMIGR
ncbi:MAG: PKD domain-containing protein [Planctomycetes bacterium]|nr:PKD domain-containing protein [Planctomycetota bacterium]